VFQPHAPLEVQNYLNDLVTVFYTDNEIAIKNTENITITNLQVFNSIGQLIYQNNNQGLLSATDVRIPFDFAQAAYILKLKATEGKGTYKFINY
ncbi:MAG: T9SS type A sorting domain-containing protein, partial [Bacteroidales bacterium]|nr:T9SS type A sorting domain-containing protein [Bacteroidales bacterium]